MATNEKNIAATLFWVSMYTKPVVLCSVCKYFLQVSCCPQEIEAYGIWIQ